MNKFITDFYSQSLPKGSLIIDYEIYYINDGWKRKRQRIRIKYIYNDKLLTTSLAFSKKLLNNEKHKGWMKCLIA